VKRKLIGSLTCLCTSRRRRDRRIRNIHQLHKNWKMV